MNTYINPLYGWNTIPLLDYQKDLSKQWINSNVKTTNPFKQNRVINNQIKPLDSNISNMNPINIGTSLFDIANNTISTINSPADLSKASTFNNGNYDLYNSDIKIKNKTDVTSNTLNGIGSGIKAGTAIAPGIGTLAGGLIGGIAGLAGGIFGNKKKKREREKHLNNISIANNNIIDNGIINKLYSSQFSYGGHLQLKNIMDNYLSPVQYNTNLNSYYGFGGDLNKLTSFNNGGTHEENIYNGIPQGNNNFVEEGETKFNDYIFSNRLKLNDEVIKLFNLPNKLKNKTFAEASKILNKESEERPLDPISKNGQDEMMDRLTMANDYIRENVNNNSYRNGGKLNQNDDMKIPEIELLTKQQLKGGKADTSFLKNSKTDVDPLELQIGIIVERGHSNSDKIAQEIALDHLSENENYYTLLYESGIADEPLPAELQRALEEKIQMIKQDDEDEDNDEIAEEELLIQQLQDQQMNDSMLQEQQLMQQQMMGSPDMMDQMGENMMGIKALGGIINRNRNVFKIYADGGKLGSDNINYQWGKKSTGKYNLKNGEDWLFTVNSKGQRQPVSNKIMADITNEIKSNRPNKSLPVINNSDITVKGMEQLYNNLKQPHTNLSKKIFEDNLKQGVPTSKRSSIKDKKNINWSNVGSALRFAPAVSGFLGALIESRKSPETVGYNPVSHIGNYMNSTPVDRNFIFNNIGRQAASNRYAMQTMSGGNVGNLLRNLQSLNYNTAGAMANAGQSIDRENYQRYADALRHNTGVDQFNTNIDQFNSQMDFQANDLNARNRAAKHNAIRQYLMSGVESLGNIGREVTSMNSIGSMFGYKPDIFGNVRYKKV